MKRTEIDGLYHQLRMASVNTNQVEKEAILGLCGHLLNDRGDYTGLLRYLDYYGQTYLMTGIWTGIHDLRLVFKRVVDFGAGLGWLGRGLSVAFDVPVLSVDKRQWSSIDIVADLESKNGLPRVLDVMQEGDLIVMSEFLHCLDDPRAVMANFTQYTTVAIEYHSSIDYLNQSYVAQIKKYGCKPVYNFEEIFPGRLKEYIDLEPFIMVVVYPLELGGLILEKKGGAIVDCHSTK